MSITPQRTPAGHRFYHDVSLRGPVPDRLIVAPPDPWGPDEPLADRLTGVASQHAEAFFTREAETFAYAQSFSWLAPLAARERERGEGRHAARALWEAWLRGHGRYAPKSWSPPLAAARTEAMLRHASLLLEGRDAPQREAVFGTLIRQTRHLARALKGKPGSEQRLTTLVGLALGGLCLPFAADQERAVKPPLAAALTALAGGALPKGLRDPREAIALAVSLQGLREAYKARGLTAPADLPPALAVLRLLIGGLRVGDGGLAVLPGGTEGDRHAIEALSPLTRAEADSVLEHYGYARAVARTSAVHVDLGRLSSDAGAAAFTLTDGADRLITAAGAPSSALAVIDPSLRRWQAALGGPAAAATLDAEGHGAASLDREESPAGTLLGLARSGPQGGHRRRLFLQADGAALLGEDQTRQAGATYRFPLHPSVEARAGTDGRATLVLPSGRSWRFESAAARLVVEDGVYAGTGLPRPTRQLVLTAEREGVRWALRRV